MATQTLVQRVERLEQRVTTLEQLPATVDALRMEVSQLRQETRAEFSAVRREFREYMDAKADEIMGQSRILYEQLRNQIALLNEGILKSRKRPLKKPK